MSYAVLVVEDEAILAGNIRQYLERHGYEVCVASSAERALVELESFRPDAVVLDFNLPGMDGLAFLALLFKIDSKIKVVMTTGHGSEQIAVDAMKVGVYDYLVKPIALLKLKLVLDKAVSEVRRDSVLSYYHARTASDGRLSKLLGESQSLHQMRELIHKLLAAEASMTTGLPPAVLITGETGTGKELVARALHYEGARSAKPFVELNCSCIPPHLLEAELFGYERGAFTDARERKLGLIESAEGGTLFLDEIGEMDIAVQAKLLRFLEDKSVRRLGSIRDQKTDVRIVAATNRKLEAMVSEGKFRSDLLFRLRIVQIELPPLRARQGDVTLLARHFLRQHKLRYGRDVLDFSEAALTALEQHDWPGNIRELSNVVEQSVILGQGEWIEPAHLNLRNPAAETAELGHTADERDLNLDTLNRQVLLKALTQTGWNVSQAARLLGVSRDAVRYRIDKFQLKPNS